MKNVLRNAWYVAGWAGELEGETLLARQLLGEPVVMFRDAAGAVHALADRCPHRFAPLSMGRLCDGGKAVECAYHGLRFDSAGSCVLNPQGGTIPKAARVRRYPLVERYSALWIWFGDEAEADPALIPEFDFLVPEHWAVGTDHMLVDAHYELESDNILDLSHIEFLHPIFSSAAVRRGEIECVQDGSTVWSRRTMLDDDLPPFLRQAFGIPEGARADRWLDVRWNAPAQLALWAGAAVAGQPREQGRVTPSAHLFTPASETGTHYFFAIGFPRALGPMAETLAAQNIAALRGPFQNEDKPIVEAVARRMGTNDLQSLKPVLLAGDAAAMRARRILQAMIAAEAAAAAAPATAQPA
ncbi:aromatic ring-hydroxylating dioxygenase subunit alpha [Derxia lacustris]|uniref:aromatic ring-hydroxylating dioxygenase subunit alpha n=1 Tax=Derxia lacustris TaxID=764842 RepID=UPI000A16F0AA|nr:aromatic ring-hydroxylating dioxygenase subunit alpha [Derxia lacustris]